MGSSSPTPVLIYQPVEYKSTVGIRQRSHQDIVGDGINHTGQRIGAIEHGCVVDLDNIDLRNDSRQN